MDPMRAGEPSTALWLLVIAVAVQSLPSAAGPVVGGALPLPHDEISVAQRTRIESAIAANIAELRAMGRLPQVTTKAATVAGSLRWPLQYAIGHPEREPRTIANFVDHDLTYPNHLRDYACGSRAYDQANGYNHQGTDITASPFGVRKMNNDEAVVVAAAGGVIALKEDGEPNMSCEFNSQTWNAIYIRHADGSVAWYGHLKNHSLTAKGVGDSVDPGEFLGVMGSSGNSTGPHLHFELHSADGQLIDPFAGPCNDSTTESWWAAQRPYYEPAINLLTTGNAPLEVQACPLDWVSHAQSYFQPGQTVYLTAYLRDQLRGNASLFEVYRPGGMLYMSTTIPSDADFYTESFWQQSVTVPAAGATGTWRFQVTFAGQMQSINFEVGTTTEPPRATTIGYYNATLNHYFMTAFPEEAAALDAGTPVPGWTRTGDTFPAYAGNASSLSTVCRFFGTPGRGINSHFYTAFATECAIVKANPNWTFEADAFFVAQPAAAVQCPQQTRPVYRLYNNGLGGEPNHRYTTSWTVISTMQAQSWLLEGVVMCAPL